MRVIKGNISELLDKKFYMLGNRDDYINAIVTDSDYVVDAIGKLRGVYKNILRLEYRNARTIISHDEVNTDNGSVKEKSPLELFKDFYKQQNNIELDSKREKEILKIIKEVSDETY